MTIFDDIGFFFVSNEGFCFPIMISLSVPIYNEEGSIEELFEKVRKVMNRHGIPWATYRPCCGTRGSPARWLA